MDALIKHGYDAEAYEVEAPKLKISADGVDTLSLSYAAPTRTAFTRGAAAPSPWTSFIISDIDQTQDADEWLLNLQCEGLQSEKQTKGHPQIDDRSDGWDTVQDEYITSNRRKFQRGQTGNYGGTTICTAVSETKLSTNVYKVRGTFTGLITPKNYSRSVTCNGQTFNGDYVVNLESGWGTARRSQIDLPRLLVTDTYYTTSKPDTSNIPGNATPPNAPNVRVITFTGEVISHWPNGWSLTISYRQLPGVTLYEVDYIYEYKLAETPGT